MTHIWAPSRLREVKVCVLGDSGVGKTCIVNKFCQDVFHNMEPTIGAAFQTKMIDLEGISYRFQIWDTAGQEKYRSMAPMYYRGAGAAILVYDITDEDSFNCIDYWTNEIQRFGPRDVVFAIAGNKADCASIRQVEKKFAQRTADKMNAIYLETSAKTGDNIYSLFEYIAERLPEVSHARNTLTRGQTGKVELSETTKKQSSNCCNKK